MIKNILKILNLKTIIAFIVYLVFRNDNKSIRAYEIKEESMKPALLPNEYVLASKLKSSPLRGDIVIFNNSEKNIDVVKRVVGLPGEEIESQEGSILINSEVLSEPWAKSVSTPAKRRARAIGCKPAVKPNVLVASARR